MCSTPQPLQQKQMEQLQKLREENKRRAQDLLLTIRAQLASQVDVVRPSNRVLLVRKTK